MKAKYNKFNEDAATSGTTYEGFLLSEGNGSQWAIRKTVVSSGITTISYALGQSGYAAAWTARASQTYTQNVALAGDFF